MGSWSLASQLGHCSSRTDIVAAPPARHGERAREHRDRCATSLLYLSTTTVGTHP